MITYAEMKAALVRAVSERGYDFVYPEEWKGEEEGCLYRLPDGSPACIIGLAMSYLKPDAVLEEGRPARFSLRNYCEPRAIDLAVQVQWRQDTRHSWGVALGQSLADLGDSWTEYEP